MVHFNVQLVAMARSMARNMSMQNASVQAVNFVAIDFFTTASGKVNDIRLKMLTQSAQSRMPKTAALPKKKAGDEMNTVSSLYRCELNDGFTTSRNCEYGNSSISKHKSQDYRAMLRLIWVQELAVKGYLTRA